MSTQLLRREWEEISDEETHLTVFHWNLLADYLSDAFPNTDPHVLTWDYRSPLIREVIRDSHADVISLVEADHYSDFYEQELNALGYKSLYLKKNGKNLDGCVLAWKEEVLTLESHDFLVLLKDNSQVAIIAFFRTTRDQGLCIATTHFKAKEGFEDIREREAVVLIERINALNTNHYPVIICGDMNDYPDSKMAKIFSQSFLPGYYMDKWTTWKKRKSEVKRTIDYIWYNEGLKPVARLSVPTNESCPQFLPASYYPSDHLSIAVKFYFKPPWE